MRWDGHYRLDSGIHWEFWDCNAVKYLIIMKGISCLESDTGSVVPSNLYLSNTSPHLAFTPQSIDDIICNSHKQNAKEWAAINAIDYA